MILPEDLDMLIFCAVHQLEHGGPPYTTTRPPEWLPVPVPLRLEPVVVALQAINGEHVRKLGMDVPDSGHLEKAAVYILAALHFVTMEDAVRETLHELLAECRL